MNKIFKSKLLFFILGALIFSSATAFAYSIVAPNVGFTPADTTWKKEDGEDITNVEEAIDDLHETCDYCKTRFNNLVWNYPYEGKEQIFPVPLTGVYKLEVWGAQGGNANSSVVGGYGAYSTGTIFLNEGEKLYLNVGGQGSSVCGTNSTANGGYNGGGKGIAKYATTICSASGGGATHIATTTGLLSELSNKRDNILIVAGGGGGSGYYASNERGDGGSGGGKTGVNGTHVRGDYYGTGGTQDSGGYFIYNPSAGIGTFGKGADTAPNGSNYYGGGGGGGYYGGGAIGSYNTGGGGGGSGYIGNNDLKDKHMTCYKCTTSDEIETKTNTTDDVEGSPQADKAKNGNGYARITIISVK